MYYTCIDHVELKILEKVISELIYKRSDKQRLLFILIYKAFSHPKSITNVSNKYGKFTENIYLENIIQSSRNLILRAIKLEKRVYAWRICAKHYMENVPNNFDEINKVAGETMEFIVNLN